MIVTIATRAEWERIIINVQPTPIYVSSDLEWFRNGRGTTYQFLPII